MLLHGNEMLLRPGYRGLGLNEILLGANEILLGADDNLPGLNERLPRAAERLLGCPKSCFIPYPTPFFTPMTDEQINFENMALNVRQLLADTRPQWAPLYPKMVADFAALDTALGRAGTQATTLAGGGSVGYTHAKDLAEIAVLDAAMPVLRGIKALQLDAPDPALAPLAAHTRTTLDELRGQAQVKTLRELAHGRPWPAPRTWKRSG